MVVTKPSNEQKQSQQVATHRGVMTPDGSSSAAITSKVPKLTSAGTEGGGGELDQIDSTAGRGLEALATSSLQSIFTFPQPNTRMQVGRAGATMGMNNGEEWLSLGIPMRVIGGDSGSRSSETAHSPFKLSGPFRHMLRTHLQPPIRLELLHRFM